MSLVYLGGGMEASSDGTTWRKEATKYFNNLNIDTWDPYYQEDSIFGNSNVSFISTKDKKLDFEEYRKRMRGVVIYDINTIINSVDVLMVKYDKSVKLGAGTHGEMTFAAYFGKPVIVWLDNFSIRKVPAWAIGCITKTYNNFEDTLEAVHVEITSRLNTKDTTRLRW
jgi:hypothetical protein